MSAAEQAPGTARGGASRPAVTAKRGGAHGRVGGELAIVLHTHMPYVEGFGTWPFGEEWLWEAMASSYLPLLELLERGAPLTVSLTPVLCDQLEAPGVGGRFTRFLGETRRYTHAEDARGLREGGYGSLAQELERAWGDYEGALESFERRGRDLLGALAPYAQWTSSATHAVLPMLATQAGLEVQVEAGVESHRARFGPGWRGGFWLPECAHVPHLEPTLADAGVHAVCVELTDRLGPRASEHGQGPGAQGRRLGLGAPGRRLGPGAMGSHLALGAPGHLRPLRGESGVMLVPIDRATIALVWSDGGYPAHGRYRDYHRHTVHHHQPWANDGDPYDHEHALALAREHAADFVARTRERLRRDGAGLPGGGLAVCALDTELLGHWWYEGIAWLEAVVEECTRQGLPLVRLDDALDRHEPAAAESLLGDREEQEVGRLGGGGKRAEVGRLGEVVSSWQASTWGEGGDLSTWSGPAVADIAFATRAAELDVVRAGARASTAAVRELLALQSSDWAFMVARGLAVPYARERFEGHRRGVQRALAAGPDADGSAVRNLAVHAGRVALLAP
ncbi:MAG TPA: 1,4-alpha-glucan branching protein domain-containing protein [Solirubrobacteraceae bacterium]|nr:1,4-alpha-glucan branching protein domain-containing protein [Solirubrobacteraceae bacterium]